MLQESPGEPFERLWCTERCRTRLRIEFWTLLSCRAKALMCSVYQFLQCFVGFERNGHETHANDQTNRKSRRFAFQHRPGSVRATQNQARAAQRERKGALEVPPGLRKIYKEARTRQLRAKKLVQSPRRASGGPGARTLISESSNGFYK